MSRWAFCVCEVNLTKRDRDTRTGEGWAFFFFLLLKKVLGEKKAGRWIYKTGGRGGDRWMEESERFTDGWQQNASVNVDVKPRAGPLSVLMRPCPEQTP